MFPHARKAVPQKVCFRGCPSGGDRPGGGLCPVLCAAEDTGLSPARLSRLPFHTLAADRCSRRDTVAHTGGRLPTEGLAVLSTWKATPGIFSCLSDPGSRLCPWLSMTGRQNTASLSRGFPLHELLLTVLSALKSFATKVPGALGRAQRQGPLTAPQLLGSGHGPVGTPVSGVLSPTRGLHPALAQLGVSPS